MTAPNIPVFAALLGKLEALGGEIIAAGVANDGSFKISVNHPDVNIDRRGYEDTVTIRCRRNLFPPTRSHVDVDNIMTVIQGWMKEAGSKCGKTALMTPTKESEAFERAFNEENELARETAAENADYGLGREITEAVRQRKANERAAALKRKRREWGVDGRGDKTMRKNVKPVHVDFDSAYNASNHAGDYTVYFDVERRRDGWWLGVAVDGGHFTDEPADGPYPTEDEAIMGGENAVWEIMGHQFRRIYWDDRLKQIRKERARRARRGIR
jgi:hypothetical protein